MLIFAINIFPLEPQIQNNFDTKLMIFENTDLDIVNKCTMKITFNFTSA